MNPFIVFIIVIFGLFVFLCTSYVYYASLIKLGVDKKVAFRVVLFFDIMHIIFVLIALRYVNWI